MWCLGVLYMAKGGGGTLTLLAPLPSWCLFALDVPDHVQEKGSLFWCLGYTVVTEIVVAGCLSEAHCKMNENILWTYWWAVCGSHESINRSIRKLWDCTQDEITVFLMRLTRICSYSKSWKRTASFSINSKFLFVCLLFLNIFTWLLISVARSVAFLIFSH